MSNIIANGYLNNESIDELSEIVVKGIDAENVYKYASDFEVGPIAG